MIGALLNYYGGKHATSHRYPRPEYRTIIEPFAGSAVGKLRPAPPGQRDNNRCSGSDQEFFLERG